MRRPLAAEPRDAALPLAVPVAFSPLLPRRLYQGATAAKRLAQAWTARPKAPRDGVPVGDARNSGRRPSPSPTSRLRPHTHVSLLPAQGQFPRSLTCGYDLRGVKRFKLCEFRRLRFKPSLRAPPRLFVNLLHYTLMRLATCSSKSAAAVSASRWRALPSGSLKARAKQRWYSLAKACFILIIRLHRTT